LITFDYKSTKRQAQIITDDDTLGMIRNHFSVKNEGAVFAKKRGMRFVKDRKYAITPTGLFDFGFYGEILKYLRDSQITDITFTDEFRNRLKCGIKEVNFHNNLKYDPRYYQKDSVIKGLERGHGIFLLATGAGKSLAQALLIENYIKHLSQNDFRFKCLIVVPGLSLVNQLQNDFLEYGVSFEYSEWTGENSLQNTEVVICNSECLVSQFEKNPWIVDVNLLITDECHKIAENNQISKIINKIKTPNKFGFTGTLSDKKIDEWKTLGTFGPIIYEKKSKELRDEEYLSDVQISVIKLNHTPLKKLTYKDELKYLYENDKRNQIIGKLSDALVGNALIMVNHLDHGDRLLSTLHTGSNKNVFFVKGEMEVEERKKIIDMMEENDNIICIAMSSIFSTGINIKNLPNIVFAGLGKSFIRVVQSIGRGLRLHEDKNKLKIFDICDNYKYSLSHALHRQEIYNKEEIPWIFRELNL
jgi:superfamily II DNA or RNA helicase